MSCRSGRRASGGGPPARVTLRFEGWAAALRNDDGTWTATFAKAGETLTMRSIGVTVDVDAVYRGLVSDGARMVLEG